MQTPISLFAPNKTKSILKSDHKIPSYKRKIGQLDTQPTSIQPLSSILQRPKSDLSINNIERVENTSIEPNIIKNNIDRAFEFDEVMIEKSNCLYSQIKKGGYNFRNDIYLLADYHPIPKGIKSIYNRMDPQIKNIVGGIFPLIKMAYIAFDSMIYLWEYTNENIMATYSFSQSIMFVEHIKNTCNIKIDSNAICYFAVGTRNEILWLFALYQEWKMD